MQDKFKKIRELIENQLTDANTGSYEQDDCGEDYFDDAINLQEVLRKIDLYIEEYNDKKYDLEKFKENIFNITIEWDVNPFAGFNSFKEKKGMLKDITFWITEEIDSILK